MNQFICTITYQFVFQGILQCLTRSLEVSRKKEEEEEEEEKKPWNQMYRNETIKDNIRYLSHDGQFLQTE